jgi:hypothetical protein
VRYPKWFHAAPGFTLLRAAEAWRKWIELKRVRYSLLYDFWAVAHRAVDVAWGFMLWLFGPEIRKR